jgi:hypothetical protein
VLSFEARPQPSQVMSLASPLLALGLTIAIAAALFLLLGRDPASGLGVFFVEPLATRYALSEVALKATPLILCALGLAVCYRANVWNIGAEGQFLLGAICAGGVALWVTTEGISAPRALLVPMVLLAGVAGGMAWAGITAFLRDRFNANEILVSLIRSASTFRRPRHSSRPRCCPTSCRSRACTSGSPSRSCWWACSGCFCSAHGRAISCRSAGWHLPQRVMRASRSGRRCGRHC